MSGSEEQREDYTAFGWWAVHRSPVTRRVLWWCYLPLYIAGGAMEGVVQGVSGWLFDGYVFDRDAQAVQREEGS